MDTRIKLGNAMKLWHQAGYLKNPSAQLAYETEIAGLNEAIKEAEGSARERTITADKVLYELKQYEEKLGIPKKALKGVTVHIDPNAQHFPVSYKYIPMSTMFWAEHNGREWVLTRILRARCTESKGSACLTSLAKDALVKAMSNV